MNIYFLESISLQWVQLIDALLMHQKQSIRSNVSHLCLYDHHLIKIKITKFILLAKLIAKYYITFSFYVNLLPRETTINTKYPIIQCKIFDVLHLNKMCFKFGELKPYLFCLASTQVFLSNYIFTLEVMPQYVILDFIDKNIEYFLLINQLLLIQKCFFFNSGDLENLTFTAFKNIIIKIKTIDEKEKKQ